MLASPDQHTIAKQRDRIEELEEALRQMRKALVPSIVLPKEWRLQPSEQKIILALYKAVDGFLTHDQLAYAFGNPNRDANYSDILKQRVCTLRKKVKQFGIEVETRWSLGYKMPAASRAILEGILAERAIA